MLPHEVDVTPSYGTGNIGVLTPDNGISSININFYMKKKEVFNRK
jgi:hypothetical protein